MGHPEEPTRSTIAVRMSQRMSSRRLATAVLDRSLGLGMLVGALFAGTGAAAGFGGLVTVPVFAGTSVATAVALDMLHGSGSARR